MSYIRNVLAFFLFLGLVSCSTHKTELTRQYDPVKQAIKRSEMPMIVIDPGHGGHEKGAHAHVYDEKDLCLKTSMFLREFLQEKGYQVIMTRSRDEQIPLKKRADIANITKSHVLVSIHFNSAKSKQAQGIEVFYTSKTDPWRAKKSKLLAQTVLSNLLSSTGAESRGVKEGNFCVIRETNMPSILVEGGFMTNDEELKKLSDERYLKKLASGVAEGLDQYFKSI